MKSGDSVENQKPARQRRDRGRNGVGYDEDVTRTSSNGSDDLDRVVGLKVVVLMSSSIICVAPVMMNWIWLGYGENAEQDGSDHLSVYGLRIVSNQIESRLCKA
ncbi:hypothetical protein SUGI_0501140 [Cryptomeria japonica]|nr:hypothetical protein SUGI_0501140 [Cryptomeria japonica]